MPVTVRNRSRGCRARSVCLVLACLGSWAALAGPFDPVIELFRLGADDHLVINRGGPVAAAGDVNGDGLDDVIVAAGVGAVRIVFGPTRGDNGRLDVSVLDGSNGFFINGDGPAVGGGGDLNGDGINDVAIGSATATYVIFGRSSGFSRSVDVATLDGSNGFVLALPGSAVTIADDLNGDGRVDLLVGSSASDGGAGAGSGLSAVVFGRAGDFPAQLSPASLDGVIGFAISGAAAGSRSGFSVAGLGDVNGDGLGDVAVGAPGAIPRESGLYQEGRGQAYVVFGQPSFPARLSLGAVEAGTGFVFTGPQPEHVAGYSVGGAGDLNRDGFNDVVIGAPGRGPFGAPSTHPGEAYVIFGGTVSRSRWTVADLDGRRGFVARGARGGTVPAVEGLIAWGDQAAASVAGAGDINADGIDDLVIGAPYTLLSEARRGNGQTYIIYGRPVGFPPAIALDALDGETGFRWNGIGTTDYSGFSVSAAGDFNADGVDDVLVGASGQGDTYVLYGRPGAVQPPSPDTPPPAAAGDLLSPSPSGIVG